MKQVAAPRFGLVVIGGLLIASCASAAPATDAELIGSTLRIDIDACQTGKVRATGISLANGWVATVAHPFDGIERFVVIGRNFDLAYLDLETDIALLFEPDAAGPHLELADDIGSGPARMISYPAPDSPPEITSIEVLRLANVTLDGQGRRQALELEADINPGDSGSPVVDERGRVLGMVFANARGVDSGWAISAAEISSALDMADPEATKAPGCD